MATTYPSAALQEIVEYRGVEGLVAAEVLVDDNGTNTAGEGETANHGYVTGPVFAIAGVAEISRTTDSSNEAHYYDNIPAVVVSNTAADEVTINASAVPFDVLATITGQNYDATTGAFIEGPRNLKYFAIGYKTQKTNGDEVYVWRYKGTFNIPDQTNSTQNDSTDANGQELVYTGISTTHHFAKTGKGAKALNVDTSKGLADVTNFFEEVTTPDTLQTVSG
jgi:phi13 family phage major tail protein